MKKSLALSLPYYNVLNMPLRHMIDIGEFFNQTGLSHRHTLTFGETLEEKIDVIQVMMMLVDTYVSFEALVASHESEAIAPKVWP